MYINLHEQHSPTASLFYLNLYPEFTDEESIDRQGNCFSNRITKMCELSVAPYAVFVVFFLVILA